MLKPKLDNIKKALPSLRLRTDVPWGEVSTLGVGSNIPIYAEPYDDLELILLLEHCSKESIPVRAIGAGSNIVGSDKPFDGIIIRLLHNCFSKIVYGRHQHITVGAGIKLSDLFRELAGKGFGGAAPLAAIPGTLGGALRMNAGARGIEIKDFVNEICGLSPDGTLWTASTEELNWDYRNVDIPDDIIITGAICKFDSVDPDKEYKLINDEFNWRNSHFPPGRSTGCVFRNLSSDIIAGKLIDDSGCKKLERGGAKVSEKHANYLINSKNASEEDYINLIIEVKKKVLSETGIKLTPEVRFLDPQSLQRVNNNPQIPEVIILKGGNSNEREVSIISGNAVEKALLTAGYDVKSETITELNDVDKIISRKQKSPQIIFPVLHGGYGEDGNLQKLLEKKNVPYVGCNSISCDLAMDKEKSKEIMKEKSLPTPEYAILTRDDRTFPENLSLPVIVKPPEEGSTVGISLVSSELEWDSALDVAFKFSKKALVEEFIKGKEITVGILGDRVLPVVEIQFPGALFDYDAKYEHKLGETLYLCPPVSVDEKTQKKAQEAAMSFAKAINFRDLTRIDLMVDEKNNIYILEANNIPGFTSSSLLPKAAAQDGISFPELCGTLVQFAYKRLLD